MLALATSFLYLCSRQRGVYGQQNEKARTHIADNELLNLFNKTQQLSDDQKKTVMDLLSAFLLKASLRQELTHYPFTRFS